MTRLQTVRINYIFAIHESRHTCQCLFAYLSLYCRLFWITLLLSKTSSNRDHHHLRSNTTPGDLLPHDIITYGSSRRPPQSNTTTPLNTVTKMESHSFLNVIQTAALKELSKFTGEPPQKVTQFIEAIEQIGAFTELNDSLLYSIATIKLGGAAYNWYDNNKSTLRTWSDLKQHLLERFKPSLSASKTQLKERKQQPGETLLIYYDDVIDLCKQVDNQMPLHMIVDYLQDGVRNELKVHVKRQLKNIQGEVTPAMFLKIARDEEELYNEMASSLQPSFTPTQPYFTRITAATSKPSDTVPSATASSITSNRNRTSQSARQFTPCLICNRSNHRTIDCYQKQSQGCYKCGDTSHRVHECPQVFQ